MTIHRNVALILLAQCWYSQSTVAFSINKKGLLRNNGMKSDFPAYCSTSLRDSNTPTAGDSDSIPTTNMLNLQVYRNPEGDRLCAVVGSEAKSAIETAGWKAAPISFASTAAQVQSLIDGNTGGIGQQVAVENPGLDNELQMALMKLYSTEEERRETISNLIKRGANMGMSMIRVAADTQNGAKTLEILMELGGSVQQSDQYGSTPLHIAAVFCNADVAEILLKNGADIEAKDKDGETPMMVLEKTIDRSQEMELGFGSVMPPDERQRQDKIKQLFDAAVASPAKS